MSSCTPPAQHCSASVNNHAYIYSKIISSINQLSNLCLFIVHVIRERFDLYMLPHTIYMFILVNERNRCISCTEVNFTYLSSGFLCSLLHKYVTLHAIRRTLSATFPTWKKLTIQQQIASLGDTRVPVQDARISAIGGGGPTYRLFWERTAFEREVDRLTGWEGIKCWQRTLLRDCIFIFMVDANVMNDTVLRCRQTDVEEVSEVQRGILKVLSSEASKAPRRWYSVRQTLKPHDGCFVVHMELNDEGSSLALVYLAQVDAGGHNYFTTIVHGHQMDKTCKMFIFKEVIIIRSLFLRIARR